MRSSPHAAYARPRIRLGRPPIAIRNAAFLAIAACAAGLALGVPSGAQASPGRTGVPPASVHPVLERSLAGDPAEREWVVWVFFRDKGLGEAEATARLERFRERLSKRALERRQRVGGVLVVDERDLPVHESYVRAVEDLGGELRHRTRWLNGASFVLSVEELRRVVALPFVREVVPVARGMADHWEPAHREDRLRTAEGGLRTSLDYGPSWDQLDELNVPPAHEAGFTGAGLLVMMLDTGFMTDHEAFSQVDLVAQYDFVFGDSIVQNEEEDDPYAHAHGTSTWSACGGYAPGNVIGPAFAASFVLAKTEDIRSELPVEEDNYVAALEWADTLGVWLTSASLSYLVFDDESGYTYEDLDGDTAVITRAVDVAAAKGILCANSIGNYGPDAGSLWTPADADTILSAGAVDADGLIASWSSRGPTYDGRTKPELCARGVDAVVASSNGPSEYGTGSGTSFSCPLLAGSAALVLEAHPEWGPVEVIAALQATGDHAGNPDNTYGWGRPDVYQAIFSQTPVYPLPFSLISPADGKEPALPVVLVWEASEDLDSGDSPLYTVIIHELVPGDLREEGDTFVHEGVADTFLVVPDVLLPGVEYRWEVLAIDAEDHARHSREIWTFVMPAGSSVPDPAMTAGPKLLLWPNPSAGGVRMRLADRSSARSFQVFSPAGRLVLSREVTGRRWRWDGRDAQGRALPPGAYWVRVSLKGGEVSETRWIRVR